MFAAMWTSIWLILVAYLVGSFPFVYLLGRLRGYDLMLEEDMHLSMWRKVGHTEGFIAIIWELLKGAAVILCARALGFETWAVACAGLAVVAGQMWSVFLRFSGEKGNSTGLGMSVVLAYQALPFALVPITMAAVIKTAASLRDKSKPLNERLDFTNAATMVMPLGMAIGFVVFPIASLALGLSGWITFILLLLLVLILLKRVTDGLGEDLRTATDKRSIIVNRLLFDRSYR